MHRLVARDERTGVADEELAVDQLLYVLLGLGLADLVVHQHLGHGPQRRSSLGALERCSQMGARLNGDEVVRPAVVGQPGLGQTQAVGNLVEAGVRLVRERPTEPRVALDGLGQRP